MVFSSFTFLFWFIPIFFIIYYAVPLKIKNIVLFFGSIIFYAWGEPAYLPVLLVSIIFNYLGGILIDRFKGTRLSTFFFIASLCLNLGILFFFKYINFFIDNTNSIFSTNINRINVALPLGISFYTFQIMSYIIDLYMGKIAVEKSVVNLGTYLCMFPQLIAGPIVVYSDVSQKLSSRRIDGAAIEDGLKLFVLGLSSKVLIANNVGMLWEEVGRIGYDRISAPLAWLGMLAYTLQIYFDFNGYSMMACGLGKLLGFEFPGNFDLPYTSKSITEYWRRWHITLSGWFREYLYIPLGGNRKGKLRTYFNLFVVWFLTGFWHGADWNFILWGLYFFVILILEKSVLLKGLNKHRVLSHIYSLLLIGFGWIIFAISDLSELGKYFNQMFFGGFGNDFLYYVKNYGFVLVLGCIFSTAFPGKLYKKYSNKYFSSVIYAMLLIACIVFLSDASFNPFLYFRF